MTSGRTNFDPASRRTAPALRPHGRRGVTALLAMLFLILITTLTLAMFHVAAGNVQTSANYSDLTRAQQAAESGLRWTNYRFASMIRPRDLAGTITPAIAANIWARPDGLRDRLSASMKLVLDQANKPIGVSALGDTVQTTTQVPTDYQGATFTVSVRQLGPADGTDARFLRVTSVGRYRKAFRSVSMDFEIEKKAKFAIVGKVPIQLGRNTLVEGPIGMTTANKNPPILMLSDFTHFDAALKTKVEAFEAYLKGSGIYKGKSVKNHTGFDGRISVNNEAEYNLASAAGYRDVNGDAYIDEYDLFVARFDTDGDGAITKKEFTSNPATGQLYEPNLFNAIDSLSPPQFNEDTNGNGMLDFGEDKNNNLKLDVDIPRKGYQDQVIDKVDARDGYSKVTGQIILAEPANDFQNWINTNNPGKTINDYMLGGIAPTETGQQTVKMGASGNDLLDLDPANFEQAADAFRDKTGSTMGTTVRVVGRIENTTLLATDVQFSRPYNVTDVRVMSVGDTKLGLHDVIPKATFDAANAALPAGKVKATSAPPTNSLDEHAPFGSTTWQATYRRPVFYGIAFKNVRIPQGINGLFENCTFQGVTFVEMERNITSPTGAVTTNKDDGMTWSKKMISGTFSADTPLTGANSAGFLKGNNLRFNNTTFEGPIASNYSTAYTHFTNSWEFTGSTMFNNKVDQTATIVAPQTNIEMGSFTDPNAAPSTLLGVVVVGNIDIRGTTVVDGSIIVTGDGAGNTTLGYFGPNDGDTSAVALPQGGFGMLDIHYNPYRTLPDGINLPIMITGRVDTYREGTR
jgi:Tfp pilus assembly protein PilX